MSLRIWDTSTMAYRDATQLDIDELQLMATAYGRIQGRFTADRAQLVKDIEAARSKAGKPNDLMVDNDKPTGDV